MQKQRARPLLMTMFFLLFAGSASASDRHGLCASPLGALRTYLCSDENLRVHMTAIDNTLTRIESHLPAQENKDLEYTENEWFSDLGTACSLKDQRDTNQTSAAKGCLEEKLVAHEGRLSDIISEKKRPAYRLSPLELEIVRNYLAPHLAIRDGFAFPTTYRALERVLLAEFPTESEAKNFLLGFNGPGTNLELIDEKYALGEQCEAHACPYAQSALVLDIESGDLVFAIHLPLMRVTVFEKECVSHELAEFAERRFRKPWELTLRNVISPQPDTPFEVKKTPCQ
jgi:hypothetical protein